MSAFEGLTRGVERRYDGGVTTTPEPTHAVHANRLVVLYEAVDDALNDAATDPSMDTDDALSAAYQAYDTALDEVGAQHGIPGFELEAIVYEAVIAGEDDSDPVDVVAQFLAELDAAA